MNAFGRSPMRLGPLIDRVAARAAEAALGRARLVNAPLRETLRGRLMQKAGAPGGLLADPVFEATFGHEPVADTMAGLVQVGLLHPSTGDALAQDAPLDPSDRDERNQMPRSRHPYTHQVEAWQSLAAEPPRCVVVSSGTGSGKTEAFLVPILDMLARERVAGAGRLVGVRALMLYPLNALIASQRDRLADWTAPFGSDLRFCLYNGHTREDVPAADARRTPWEVLDRTTLRAEPPPILVTNATMLEYMLVRPQDAGLLRRSQGRLRTIVLDEAHTYLGSQAAEMTLLLRRTLRAFGVEAGQVRFVATSATLGSTGDEARTRKELQRFLANLAGAETGRVDVVLGRRLVPPLRPGSYGGLADDSGAAQLRATLADAPQTLSALRSLYPGLEVEDVLERGMDQVDPVDGAFLPLRLHLFHRAQAGVFACLDPQCCGRAGTPLDQAEWPFGAISERDRTHCLACRARMLEVKTCDDCGAPVLEAALSADARQLERWRSAQAFDEFAPDGAPDGDGDEADDTEAAQPPGCIILGPVAWKGGSPILVDPVTGALKDSTAPGLVSLKRFDADHCSCCGAGGAKRTLFRPIRMGGPFFLATAGNVLLDAAPPRSGSRLPHGGRQLITFTDNRQGTARFAASWQQDHERNFVRARIWHALQEHSPASDGDDPMLALMEPVLNNPATPEAVRQQMQPIVEKLRREREARLTGKALPWPALRDRLATLLGHEREMLAAWKNLEPHFAEPGELAALHLLGEFLRRPMRANNMETMGFAALRFPAVERQGEAHLPALFRSRGASVQDWRDYLHLLLTYVARANSAVVITPKQSLWIGLRVRPRLLMPPGQPIEPGYKEIAWPFLRATAGRVSRAVLMLRDGLDLDFDDPTIRQDVNDTLHAAWRALQGLSAQGLPNNGFQLDLAKAEVTLVDQVWRCPKTHRLLDRTFRGLSPFSPSAPGQRGTLRAEPFAMPRHPHPWPQDAAERGLVETWLRDDPDISALRERGLWTDIADRLAVLAPYARIVEHSAQQPAWRLRDYEAKFKRGEVNVLNCSTTMEMGVDIGGITTVAMANVPPSPASYRQRVGRAGRRNEALSVAFTYCPDTPVGWHAFDRPGEPLRQGIAPPRVALDSRTLAQRHANALLLATFLRLHRADLTKMVVAAFLAEENGGESPAGQFTAWLRAYAATDGGIRADLSALLHGTGLAGAQDVAERAGSAMDTLAFAWREERFQMQADFDAAVGPARTALELQLRRFDGEYLLGELVRWAWLPGHGFPTGVVPFVVPPAPRDAKLSARPDEGRRSSHPTRTLNIAVREYAPGADVILDGVVYRSGGVTLNWKRPANEAAAREIQALSHFWHCRRCGASGEANRRPELCAGCGSIGDLLRSERVLRPAGFAADPDRPMTNAMDWVERVPTPRAHVSCAGAPWTATANAAVGRFRRAADGSVMALSRGAGSGGYAICLACGRAEPEAHPADQRPPLPAAMSAHRPLRTRRENMRCEGGTGDRVFAVQRHLALCFAKRTEVFELQLFDVTGPEVAETLAVALREALCRRLGIERDEVSCDAELVPGPVERTWSIWLYDVAAGGAGYAGTAGAALPDLLRAARIALDCSNDGCERACPACLITRDTAGKADRLDRKATAAVLDDLLPRLSLPPASRVFGSAGEHMTSAPLPAELQRAVESTPGATLTLLLHGAAATWDLPGWWGAVVAERLARAGYAVRLMAASEALEKAGLGEVLELRALQDRAGGKLRVVAWSQHPCPKTLLATVVGGTIMQAWATMEVDDCVTASLPPTAVVHSMIDSPLEEKSCIDLSARASALSPTAHRMRIGPELDGPVTAFGTLFWELLRSKPGMKSALAGCGRLHTIIYSDRYLLAPIALRLLLSVIKALNCLAGTSILVKTMQTRDSKRDALPIAMHHDWQDSNTRNAVLVGLLSGIKLSVKMEVAARDSIPHVRTLKLQEDGGAIELILDQGFGFWRPERSTTFPFTQNPQAQVLALLHSSVQIAGERNRMTEVFAETIMGQPKVLL